MFTWFNLTKSNLDQLLTIEANFIIFRKSFLTSLIMKTWVSCALDQSCISPPGSTPECCRLSTNWFKCGPDGFGCHRFDQSALTLALLFFYRYPSYYTFNPSFAINFWENDFYNFYELVRRYDPNPDNITTIY